MYSNLHPKNTWFLQHLNWSAILFYLFIALPIMILSSIGDGNQSIILYYLSLALTLYILLWNIKHKGRSAYNLLYLLLPVGWLVILCIRNRSQLTEDNKIQKELWEAEYSTKE